jgi:hypothetical protein
MVVPPFIPIPMGNIPTPPPIGMYDMGLTPPPPPTNFYNYTGTKVGDYYSPPYKLTKKCAYCGQYTAPDSFGACPCCAGHEWVNPDKELARTILKAHEARIGPTVTY